MPEVALERSIQSRIREAWDRAEEPNAREIATTLLDEFDAEAMRDFAIQGLSTHIRTFVSDQRPPTTGGSGRWSSVASAQESGELDLARISVFTGKDMKWLLDCTAGDLREAADHELRIALAHEAYAARLDKLSRAVKRTTGAQVVGDLDSAKVRTIFSD